MKKIFTIGLVLLLVSTVIAVGIGLNGLDETRELPKAERDILLSMTDSATINPDVSITCSDDYCLYDVKQQGIIDSRNNKVPKYWMNCTEFEQEENTRREKETIIYYNITTSNCLEFERVNYTNAEIEDMIAEKVMNKLSRFAKASLEREAYADWGSGSVTVNEKR